MTRFLLVVVIGVVIASFGCGGAADNSAGARQGTGDDSVPATSKEQGLVNLAANIAREIEARPDQAAAILQKYGKTREEFEALLYDIAADPELSRTYKQALGR